MGWLKVKAIIPLAGKGTRLRPHTYSKPKPLLHVAGKPVLGHILNSLLPLNLEEVAFITGDMEGQIKLYVKNNYQLKTSYFKQEEMLGDGHAISMAKDAINSDVLVMFSDTLFVKDIKSDIENIGDYDGIVWANKTETPERFGILNTQEKQIVEIEEKPENPKSDMAIIGLYYFKDSNIMFSYLKQAMEKNVTSKGEYRLADAMAMMIEDKIKLKALAVDVWLDTGKKETLLEANKYLLENGHEKNGRFDDDIIKHPVYIEDNVKIQNSIIGPNVSIARDTVIKNSIIENSIIGKNTIIENANLKDSLIGDNAEVKLKKKSVDTTTLNIGDTSQLQIE